MSIGDVPLAEQLRPQSLDEFVGQEHLVGKGKPIRRMIENKKVISMVFWGPPGTGKTTLARIIAKYIEANFVPFSAVAGEEWPRSGRLSPKRKRITGYFRKRPFYLLTKFIDLTKLNKMPSCRMLKTER